MAAKVWFITGASSGFGRLSAELALSKGDKVVATLRKPEVLADLKAKYPSEQLLVLKLDVTKSEDVTAAFQRAKEAFGRIDVVFSNAGYSVVGEAEGTPDEHARAVFDVNYWGSVNVLKEAAGFMRDVNKPMGGRVLVMGSLCGIVPLPSASIYTASKFALEGYTETFATELDPEWNIKITILECGFFHTKFANNSQLLPAHPAYTKPTLPTVYARSQFSHDVVFPGDAEKAVAKFYELTEVEDPPVRIAFGKDAVMGIKAKLAAFSGSIDKYESWSDDVARQT